MIDFSQFFSDLRQWGMEFFGKYYGPYRAIVLSNKDPLGLGRVKIRCPRARVKESGWILPMTMGAGRSSGMFWPPEPNDMVFIFFDNGNPETPLCYSGGWYAEGDFFTVDGSGSVDFKPEAGKAPFKRALQSPGEHRLIFDDSIDSENIAIKTSGGHTIILSDEKGKESVTVRHKNGKIIKITTEGKVRIGDENGKFEPMLRGSTVKKYLENHTHPHPWGPTGIPIQPFPIDGLSDDSETS